MNTHRWIHIAGLSLVFCVVGLTSPAHADEEKPSAEESSAENSAQKELGKLLIPVLERHRGKVSVMIKHLPSGQTFGYRADEPMPTASLIKFPLLMASYKAIDEGELELDQLITLKQDDKVPGSGVLTTHFSPGLQLSLRDAMQLMIAYSDNTATNLVIDQVGLEATNELMESLGCDNTRLHSKVFRRDTSIDPERSKKFGLGSTSCEDMVKLVEMLHDHQFLSEERSTQVLEHLYACENDSTVPRLLPSGVRVAHKTGSVNDSRTDAGLIDSPKGAIAFCVLTTSNEDRRWSDKNEGELLAAEIGLAAYNYFAGDAEPEQPTIARTLELGASGELVEALQRTLNARVKPSPGISVDGDFGPNTESAVIAFQKQVELEPDGVVDRQMWQKLGPLVTEDAPPPSAEEIAKENSRKEPLDPLAGPPIVTCKAWCFVDAETGEQIAGENVDAVRDPASITKIMTAFLVLKQAENDDSVLDQQVTFSERADKTPGSTSGLRTGELIAVRHLLYGLLLPSGNDASVALAEHFGDQTNPEGDGSSYDKFIAAMNAEADRLGMENTGYRNPHGLTAKGHVTTARDMTKLARAALEIPLMRKIVGTRRYVVQVDSQVGYQRSVSWRNTNRLLRREGYSGVKTGTTGAAGACLVACGERNGKEVISVVLGSSSTDARYADMRNLYRYVWTDKLNMQDDSTQQTNAPLPAGN